MSADPGALPTLHPAGQAYAEVQLGRAADFMTVHQLAREAAASAPASEAADVEPVAVSALRATGDTAADALQALADALRQQPDLAPESLAIARTVLAEEPGVVEYEWRVIAVLATAEDVEAHEADV